MALPGTLVAPLTSANRLASIVCREVLKLVSAAGSPDFRTSSARISIARLRLDSGLVPRRRISAVFWPDRSSPRNTASRKLPVP
ncbi:hypothetical protein D3C86_2042580 [compost metagenome]